VSHRLLLRRIQIGKYGIFEHEVIGSSDVQRSAVSSQRSAKDDVEGRYREGTCQTRRLHVLLLKADR
jgi:hypothetical protein